MKKVLMLSLFIVFVNQCLTAQTYCAATGPACDIADNSDINEVSVNAPANFIKTSGCGTGAAANTPGYSDFTSSIINLVKGTQYTINVVEGKVFSGDICLLYIDYNRDGDFIDVGESITMGGSANVQFTGPISIPDAALIGNTRMRVRVFDGLLGNPGFNSPCGATAYGEVEDYTVNISAPVPVQLMHFKGRSDNNINQLYWKSASEKNVANYEIERSTDANNFRVIATIPAKNTAAEYQYADDFLTNMAYYRLKMIDLDHTFNYSDILAIQHLNSTLVVPFPNPANDILTVASLNVFDKIEAINMYGQKSNSVIILDNNSIDISNLTAGKYILSLGNRNTYLHRAFVKQ